MIKVSVTILTYNQKQFIGKAIESALSQKTNFDVEILVGDDCSTDGAQETILAYQEKYPDKVKAVLHSKNLGQNGLFNTIETLKLAKGTYIAPMDGDDYWTDDQKLQRQVDFMEAHPDFSACFHNALITYEDGTPSHELNSPDQKEVITAADLVGEDEIWFMATSAVMFKNGIMHYPDWFLKSSSGDIPRYVILAKHGPIGYVPGVMSVYRKNRGGASFKDHYRDARFLYNRIAMYEGIDKELDYRHHDLLRLNIARYYRMLLDAKQYQKSYFRRARLALKYLQLGQPPREISKEVIRDYVLPKWMMNVYSFFALLPHRLKESSR
ncbi:glycosyltransferase involved in cell wall biosynthesis [Runella defluvii]|uniref:Glycosyltransferase involved in cell wall biosynthesis n=1 Tax=Runella defluvii TaxID=370973 RepID=A0A7W5ZNV2_9BACT|nr:glycosyltransferase family 2 protein [Runella defluvii]MBB3840922.1 glycosyltransferase involved in cell wall biosynthesis [Runella defluvii]